MAEALAATGARLSVELLRGELTTTQARRLAALGVVLEPPEAPDAVLADLPDPNAVGRRWPADRLAVFDDREWFRGAAAVVIPPSLPAWRGRAPAARVLAGYAFAPIRSRLQQLAADPIRAANPGEDGHGLVVCFGGSDPADVGGRLSDAWADLTLGWAATVIVGSGYRGVLSSARAGSGTADPARPQTLVLRDPPDFDRRLADARLVVAAAGTMKFELALLGRPAILVAVTDDQLPVGPPFAMAGTARFLGDGRHLDPSVLRAAIHDLIGDPESRASMSAHGRALVDGRGAERLAAVILEVAARA